MQKGPMRILIVDDEEELLYNLAAALEHRYAEVKTAINGVEALDVLRHHKIDLILSDIKMPLMDGINLLKEVKSIYPEKYFILMTGFSELLETTSAYELGADDFLAKPFRINDLSDCINECLERNVNREQKKNLDSQYQRIPVEYFAQNINFDIPVFYRLSKYKYIKVAHRAEQLSSTILTKFKEQGIIELYVSVEDYKNFLSAA